MLLALVYWFWLSSGVFWDTTQTDQDKCKNDSQKWNQQDSHRSKKTAGGRKEEKTNIVEAGEQQIVPFSPAFINSVQRMDKCIDR